MLFTYEAFNKNGGLVKGEVDANDEKSVVLYLESKDLIPSKIKSQAKKGVRLSFENIQLFQKIKTPDIIFMIRNLSTAIRAGLSMSEALDILINDSKPGPLRNIVLDAKSAVQSGRPLSEAFAEHKKIFPPVFIGLLKAGEVSSQLDKALEELSSHLIKEYGLIRKIRSALVYPTLLFIASIGVVVFLLVFVLPRLARTFAQSASDLPIITKVLLAISNFMSANIILMAALLGGLIGGLIYARRTDWGRKFIEDILFRTPVVSDLIKRVSLVRFTRTLGSLLAGASPVLEALNISADAIGNDFYKEAIHQTADKVRAGVPLSKSLQAYPDLFPTLLTSLVAVGEKTGNLEYVLNTFSNFYDEEVDNKLKDLTTLFEPLLLIVMGLVVGGVALAILLPIYQLVGEFT